jgi:superfamily II DNA or RNA helicase
MDSLFDVVKEMAEPAEWSAGVELARNAEFQGDATSSSDEQSVRILQGKRDKIIAVTVSTADAVWQCDCTLEADPCRHVVAVVLAIRQNKIQKAGVNAAARSVGVLVHCFTRSGDHMAFSRQLRFSDSTISVDMTLMKSVAELQKSNRVADVSDAEMRIDHVLTTSRHGVLDPKTMRYLIPALSRVRYVEVDGQAVSLSSEPLVVSIEVIDEDGGFRVRRLADGMPVEYFDNGAALLNGRVYAVEDSALRMDELSLLKGAGTFFPRERGIELATRIVPALQAKARVSIRSEALPRARRIPPRVVVETIADHSGESLTVIPHLTYGEPEIARIRDGQLVLVDLREVPIRDVVEEARLVREVAMRLGAQVGEAKVVTGDSAVRYVRNLRGWSTIGDGIAVFTPVDDLRPVMNSSDGGLQLHFASGRGGLVEAEQLMQSWKMGKTSIQLPGTSGWASLPIAWLEAHGAALERLLEAQREKTSIPAAMVSEVSEVCESLGVAAPEYFARLKAGLERVDEIPDATLPTDLTAELRSYQRVGVNWMSFLHAHGLGALLADDMGLGKTLQALCVVKGRSLIVCPTSVLSSWRQQIAKFRPALRVHTYHGANRSLDSAADVTLTSYAILRLDRTVLSEESWDTLIFDEAQIIRNPESQVSQAAYSLKATHRISLSGTPVENSLEDLWSQCHVLNPGLLGTLHQFRESFEEPIRNGDIARASKLRERVSPFILRRLKRDVAKELPPKTEVILECELAEQERTVYEAILLGVQSDVVARLGEGASVISALEALLRLRQACCHIGLVPGHDASSSSKIDLLLDCLERSIEQGHRALVFSQWTSLLDKIEPHLTAEGIQYSRIDGSTQGRGELVERFQSPDGPPVMLLSLKAGGLGITLTRADHVYIVDPWWNPAVEDQAADRAYRIGQENPVIVHRLVAKDTIEARILELQSAKRALLTAAIGESDRVALSRQELLELLRAA